MDTSKTILHNTIMVVDDDSVTRMTLCKMLQGEKYNVIEATSGETALEQLEKQKPDLILMDVLMPGINGFEACQRIRDKYTYNEVPVIMLTGLNDVSSVDDAFDAGANDFITKPINWPLLIKRVRYALRDRQIQLAMEQNEARLNQAQQIAKLAYWQLDKPTQKMLFSDTFYQQFPSKKISLNSFNDYLMLTHPEDRTYVQNKFTEHLIHNKPMEFDHRFQVDHKTYVFHLNIEASNDQNGGASPIQGIVQNITQQRNAEALLEFQKNHDDITGLSNKRHLHSQLQEIINNHTEDKQLIAIMAIGFNRFDEIHHSIDNHSMDILFRCIAQRLKGINSDNILGRYNTDTFICIQKNIDRIDMIEQVVENIQSRLKQAFMIEGQEIFLDSQVGISIFPMEDDSADALITNSIIALNSAKQEIHESICFHSQSMNTRARKFRDIESQIRKAIDENRLELFYQPQIDIHSRQLVGAEALIRLKLSDNNWMSPIDFIPVAEETGLIIPVGYWIIDSACQQIKHWLDSGMHKLRVGINLSAKQFGDRELVNKIDQCVAKYNLPSECIDLEITESIALQNIDQTIDSLQIFRQRGYTISMDDFGTGYSSLSSLHLLPIDMLKIDRAFIKDIGPGGENGTMAKTIINMAHNLGLSVIAEGAEEEHHITFLRHNGCNEVQGFYYSRPLPAKEFYDYYTSYIAKTGEPLQNENLAGNQ
ncbi:MAG: EAL domain-containing protein [Gammaproteobacteria bacterium]|nr:EAL domain-containing protein [Gammaproteobacteria bacterium]